MTNSKQTIKLEKFKIMFRSYEEKLMKIEITNVHSVSQ